MRNAGRLVIIEFLVINADSRVYVRCINSYGDLWGVCFMIKKAKPIFENVQINGQISITYFKKDIIAERESYEEVLEKEKQKRYIVEAKYRDYRKVMDKSKLLRDLKKAKNDNKLLRKSIAKELEKIADKLYGSKSAIITSTEYIVVKELRTLAKALKTDGNNEELRLD